MASAGGRLNRAFGQVLRGLRERAHLSQEQLAAMTGLQRTYISILERGKRSPTLDTIAVLARALQRPPHYLVRQAENAPRGADR
jgi:transcriptional regulator with XRE-family HTH domain